MKTPACSNSFYLLTDYNTIRDNLVINKVTGVYELPTLYKEKLEQAIKSEFISNVQKDMNSIGTPSNEVEIPFKMIGLSHLVVKRNFKYLVDYPLNIKRINLCKKVNDKMGEIRLEFIEKMTLAPNEELARMCKKFYTDKLQSVNRAFLVEYRNISYRTILKGLKKV